MRKSNFFFLCLTVYAGLLLLLFVHAFFKREAQAKFIREKGEMVRTLGLTDLCLFTEASYTRHLSQADLHTAFQDSPMSLEHFPSGSIVAPPPGLRKINGKMD